MIRLFQIAVLGCISLALTGCNASEKNKPIWEGTKIGDIAPSHGGKRPGDQLLKTINFGVYVFEMPAENVSTLDNVWPMLYTPASGGLRFYDHNAFRANSFSVGFGQIRMWNEIADLLRAADSKSVRTVSLLLLDTQPSDIPIAPLHNEQTVFYISTDGSTERVNIGPGELVLRIRAQRIPGSRDVCDADIIPVFSPPIRASIPQLAARERLKELPFTSCRFGVKMRPGDFAFLGPVKYMSHQITLGSLFFSRPEGSLFFSETKRKPPERKPAVRMFLLVCAGMNY